MQQSPIVTDDNPAGFMEALIERYRASRNFKTLLCQLSDRKIIPVANVVGSARPLVAYLLLLVTRRPVVYVSRDENFSRVLADLQTFSRADVLSLSSDSLSRLKTLRKISVPSSFLLVVSHTNLSLSLPEAAALPRLLMTVKTGDNRTPAEFIDWLEENGYERTDLVSESGEWSARGGIVDCFPPDQDNPIRIEFFGDRIESIRQFDPLTQRSISPLAGIDLCRLTLPPESSKTITQLLPPETILISENELSTDLTTIVFADERAESEQAVIDFGQYPPTIYLGNFMLLKSELAASEGDYYIFCGEEYQKDRLTRIVGQKALLSVGTLSQGFTDPESGYTVITESELYGMPVMRPPKRKFKGLPMDSLLALHTGDYVVHIDYGIGMFEGITRLPTGIHKEKDFLLIRYGAGEKLYLPVENIGLLDRYLGAKDNPPALDRLGSQAWLRAKARVARATEVYARDLVEVYARRTLARKTPFSPDSPEQTELEASFPYAETADQLTALSAIKKDMESAKPMERLICGDVGYGKTELAVRAAFKAVMNFKQVAVIVPTTILCYQHYTTFKKRLDTFPVRIEMVSRFVSRTERMKILADLSAGTVDIIVGTHALLGPQVKFKDLGLLILDEEQKFGVHQKDRLKKLKSSFDILSLSATPIPRTLYMSLVGLRDISPIHTPPLGRKEITTEVNHWDDGMIREWIRREYARRGQIFFVHNRIESLERISRRLQRLLPEITIATAHGRMDEKALARIYLDFLARKYDLLVSTAIVESGLDLPTVNTIIVNDAHRFGLADLHQLRGRVGRSQHQAYALFLIPETNEITGEAKKRLSAIVAYSQLGAGFKLAMRDMEIRGVGNLLGTEQHGHISRVGFSLYCQLLKEALAQLKGEEVAFEPELHLDIEAHIPESYIADSFERIAIYKRLLEIESPNELAGLKEELRDRFGRHPVILENLFKVAEIKFYVRQLKLKKVTLKGDALTLVGPNKQLSFKGDLESVLKKLRSAQ
jgi:transcription-repair coupling factor (superfamily II helicase)